VNSALLVSALIVGGAFAANSGGVDLAALDGWDIVVAPDAIASEIYAAEEFRDHLALAGGAKFSIVSAAEPSGRQVFIGPGQAMRKSSVGFETIQFGPEDLRIVVRDENIAIAGGRPRGTLYGVYTFLEDYLGVRFLTADHTHVPPLGPWRTIGPIDRTYHPPLDWRWSDYETNYDRADFAARLRLNGDSESTVRTDRVKALPPGSKDWSVLGKVGGRSSMRLVNHSFLSLLPASQYGDDYPEYYMLWKGERWAEKRYEDGRFHEDLQPCLSNPNVRRIVTENALAHMAAHPDLRNIAVGQNDGSKYCRCDDCAAIDQREGSPMGSVLTIVNRVADEVAGIDSNRMVGTLAYAYTETPPKTLRPRPNVQIMYCQDQCFIHALDDPSCPRNADQYDKMRAWSEITDHLHIWSYYFNHDRQGFQLPLPNLQWIGRDLRAKVAMGVKGMFMQASSSSHGNEFEELRNYVLSRIMWDPTQSARRLMDEWLDLYYGQAAPPIRGWLDRLHARAVASGLHRRCLGGRYDEYGLDDSVVQFGLDAVEEAMRLADSDRVRERVEVVSIWALRAALESVWYGPGDGHVKPELAAEVRPIAIEFFDLCRKHGVKRTASGGHLTLENVEKRLKGHLGAW
jgi:hypothetical protein